MNNENVNLKPCPYCNGTKLSYSVKVRDAHKQDRDLRYFHLTYTCNSCNSYGRRVLITASNGERHVIKNSVKYKQLAADAWNSRGEGNEVISTDTINLSDEEPSYTFNEEPKLINNWSELRDCESETHVIDMIHRNCGFIRAKKLTGDFNRDNYYLSTHTFYGHKYEKTTQELRKRGFNVTLANWDKKKGD